MLLFRWSMAKTGKSLPLVQSLHIYLSNTIKIGVLVAVVLFFLISMIILGWQIYLYHKHTRAKKSTDTKIKPKKKYTEKSNLSTPNNSSDFLAKSDKDEYSDMKLHDYKVYKLQESIQKLNHYLQSSSDRLKLIQSNEDLVAESNYELTGKLKFSLSYDKIQSKLQLTILQAFNVPARHAKRTTDSFIRTKLFISLLQYQCILHQWDTKIVKNTSYPCFGDHFTCSVESDVSKKATLKLQVWDFDKYSRCDALGEVRISLSNLDLSNTMEFCEDLQSVQKEVIGEIFVSLKYLPTAQKLEVGLLKLKIGCLSNNQNTDIYIRVDFYVNQHKLKHQKTPAKPKSEVTVFNEVIFFTVSDTVINQSMIITSVYEISLANDSRKQLLGRAYIGRKRSKEKDHWQSMLQSLRQPVSEWHPLLI
ncbi:synaptotagmin-2 isoform X2 [Hypanus sabinus]|uniref:synaptotagmin-2 isoform X2 n=1 Tax=Hypanus sabinus TaxID=79690 RepID=UPI0028C49599|nr:synaptotagmin-2 isoform X2 [Hypanus sabinus]